MEARPPLQHRKLRIAWTAFFAALTIALAAMWVGSISHHIAIMFPVSDKHCIVAYPIRNALVVCDEGDWRRHPNWHTGIKISSLPSWWILAENQVIQHGPFAEYHALEGTAYGVSFWLLIATSSCLALLSWIIQLRFSLRTLLIATTIVAVGLGLLLCAAKK